MKADVFKKGILAAHLSRQDGGTVFSYAPDYLKADLPPVATSLPLTDQPVFHAAGAVPPFFAGLLPEGRRLSVLRMAIKASADDELALLLAVGRDTVGDVQVIPAGESPSLSEPLLELPAGDLSRVSLAEVLADTDYDRVALPGVQDKLSGKVINLPGQRGTRSLLVKLDPPEYPHVTANEAAFLELARHSGLAVPEFELVHDRDQRPALLVTRFDRHSNGGALAMEDAAQVLRLWPADKYNRSYEEAVAALTRCTAAAPVARLELFRQITFAWLTGNGDLHAKNLAILENRTTGEWQVSPAYDLPSTVPYGDLTLALDLAGSRDGVSRKKLIGFADTIGVPKRAAERAIDQLLRRTSPVLSDLRTLNLPYGEQTMTRWQRELDYRRRQLSG